MKNIQKDHSKTTTRDILAVNVTFLRHKNGWSQEELADRSGRSVSLISDIENANIGATIDAIDDIALVFGTSTSELTKNHNYIVTKKRVDGK